MPDHRATYVPGAISSTRGIEPIPLNLLRPGNPAAGILAAGVTAGNFFHRGLDESIELLHLLYALHLCG